MKNTIDQMPTERLNSITCKIAKLFVEEKLTVSECREVINCLNDEFESAVSLVSFEAVMNHIKELACPKD